MVTDKANYLIQLFDDILLDIKKEMVEAHDKYGNFNSTHEAYAVLQEEVNEFWTLVQSKTSDINREGKRGRMVHELTQVAAVAIRIITELRKHEINQL